jgi:hypothetical protein
MLEKGDAELWAMSKCQLESLLGVTAAMQKSYEAADGEQYARETEEREQFMRYRQRVLNAAARLGM